MNTQEQQRLAARFEDFYAIRPMAFRVVYSRLGTIEDTEDTLQDLYASIWRLLPSLEHVSSAEYIRRYVLRAAAHQVADRLRRAGRHPISTFSDIEARRAEAARESEDDPYVDSLASGAASMEKALEQKEQLAEALALLPPDWQEEVHLKHIDGLKGDEIARRRGEKYCTYKTHRQRLYKRLEKSLAQLATAWQ